MDQKPKCTKCKMIKILENNMENLGDLGYDNDFSDTIPKAKFIKEIIDKLDFPGSPGAKPPPPNAGGLDSILGQRPRFHMLQLSICLLKLKIPQERWKTPRATAKTQSNQISNK